jgi:predicted DNA-binding ribbon-helix-helix protein
MTVDPGSDPRPPAKRSLTIQGHRTSVSLEPAFWDGFRAMAARRGASINALAARIDAARPAQVGLATAIRLAVLADVTARLAAALEAAPDHAGGGGGGGDQPIVPRIGNVSSNQ